MGPTVLGTLSKKKFYRDGAVTKACGTSYVISTEIFTTCKCEPVTENVKFLLNIENEDC